MCVCVSTEYVSDEPAGWHAAEETLVVLSLWSTAESPKASMVFQLLEEEDGDDLQGGSGDGARGSSGWRLNDDG